MQPAISIQRATILMAMSRSWVALAGQKERLEELEREAKSWPIRAP
jgi:hypothetical protein